jgi:hypothetical protein
MQAPLPAESVAQYVLVFSMSFQASSSFMFDSKALMREVKMEKGKPAWVSWDVMIQPKYMGGVSFLDIRIFIILLC